MIGALPCPPSPEMEGDAQGSSTPTDHVATSLPLASNSSGLSLASPVPELYFNQCATWEDAKCLLLFWQVPEEDLPFWEILWKWDRLKEFVASPPIDRIVLSQRLMELCRRVEGTRDSYECLVREQEGQKGGWCLRVIGRQDRMRGHICDHLGIRMFQCEGQCGQAGCTDVFLQDRYLQQHVHTQMVECSRCANVMHKRNLSTHHC